MGELGRAHIGPDYSGFPDGRPETLAPHTPSEFSILIDNFVENFIATQDPIVQSQLNDEFQTLVAAHPGLYQESLRQRREDAARRQRAEQ